MKLYSTRGIVFRTVKYSETSLILDIFTLDRGLGSYIVSGVRSSKSRNKSAIYQPANIIELIAYEAESNKLSRIKETNYYFHYADIQFNVIKSSVLIFMLEVSRNTIKEKEANPELYYFIEEWFRFLDQAIHVHPCYHLRFMIELSVFAGFEPMNNYSDQTKYFDLHAGDFISDFKSNHIISEESSKYFHVLLQTDRNSLENINIPKQNRDEILKMLLDYFSSHLSYFREVLSLTILKTIL